MIELTAIQRVIRNHATLLSNHFRPTFLCSHEQVSNALEYALASAVKQKRDVWQNELLIPARAFWASIADYYRNFPTITSDYTASYLINFTEPRTDTRSKHLSEAPVQQLLRVELF